MHVAFSYVLVLLFALWATACSRNDVAEQYAQVKSGMSPEEVHALLGKPDEVVGGREVGEGSEFPSMTELWYKGSQTIAVQYMNNKVKLKTMEPSAAQPTDTADPAEEALEDRSEADEPPAAPGPPGAPQEKERDLNVPAS